MDDLAQATPLSPEDEALLDRAPTAEMRDNLLRLFDRSSDDAMKFARLVATQRIERAVQVAHIRGQLGDDYPAHDRTPYRPREFAVFDRRDAKAVVRVKAVRRRLHVETAAGKTPDPWRITSVDQHGPSGHMEFRTLDEVAKELWETSGQQVPGQINAWSQTETWAKGIEWLAERHREVERQHTEQLEAADGAQTQNEQDSAGLQHAREATAAASTILPSAASLGAAQRRSRPISAG